MKVTLTYKDGCVAEFNMGAGFDPLELDLDTDSSRDIFEIKVEADRTIFSAYHWHNDPDHSSRAAERKDVMYLLYATRPTLDSQ